MSKNLPVLRLSLQLFSLLALGISPVLNDIAYAQQIRIDLSFGQRPNDRQRGNPNQNGCFSGDGRHRVPCPFDGDIFYRERGDRADGSEEWFRNDHQRVTGVCVNPADRSPLAGEALGACLEGARAANLYATDAGGQIGEIEGYRYGYTYGLRDGADDATRGRDRRGNFYSEQSRAQGARDYTQIDSILANQQSDRDPARLVEQLGKARNVMGSDMSSQAIAGFNTGSTTDGPNKAVSQFEDFTLGRTQRRPDITWVDTRVNIPPSRPNLPADPFGERVNYTNFCTFVDRLDLIDQLEERDRREMRRRFSRYNDWNRNTIQFSFLERFYFNDSDRGHRFERPFELCLDAASPFYRVRKWYNNEDGSLGFGQWLRDGRHYRAGEPGGVLWVKYHGYAGGGRGGFLPPPPQNEQQGPGELGQGPGEQGQVQGSLVQGRPGQGGQQPPQVTLTLVPPVDQAQAFRIGFQTMYRNYYDRAYQIRFSRSMEQGFDDGSDMGFDASSEVIREQARAAAYNLDYVSRVSSAHTDGYTAFDGTIVKGYAQGYAEGFRKRWHEYNSTAVLGISVEGVDGVSGDATFGSAQVFRPGEKLNALVKVTNFGGQAANLKIAMRGDDVEAKEAVVLPDGAIAAMTANVIKSVKEIAVVKTPIQPYTGQQNGIKSAELWLDVTPSLGLAKSERAFRGLQEWVALNGFSPFQAMAYQTSIDARTGAVTVTAQNNSTVYPTPQNVSIVLKLDDVVVPAVGQTAENPAASVGTIAKSESNRASTKSANFQFGNLIPLKLLEGSNASGRGHRLDVEILLGDRVAARGGQRIEVGQDQKVRRIPDLANRILQDYGRKADAVFNKYGYQARVNELEVGGGVDMQIADRAKTILNELVVNDIRSLPRRGGMDTLNKSSLQLLSDLYHAAATQSAANSVYQGILLAAKPAAYIYNNFSPVWTRQQGDRDANNPKYRNFDKRTRAFVMTDLNALNTVATATYLIEFNNLAKSWNDVANGIDSDLKNRVKDILRRLGLNDDRLRVGADTARMTVWDRHDMVNVPAGNTPKWKSDIRFFWIDGEHADRVSSTESAGAFRDYWKGDKDIKPAIKREISGW